MVGHLNAPAPIVVGHAAYLRFIERFESIFCHPHASVDWERYLWAIAAKQDSCFRGPGFLSISPARSATTWLFEQLRRNPSICLPPIKETNYFANGWLEGPYERYFPDWQPERLAGDISPAYYSLPRRAARAIHQAYPDLRLLCILRNPIERVWSQIVFDLTQKDGGIGASLEEVSTLSEEAFLSLAGFYSGSNYYAAFLERWLDSFPPEQLFVDFFDRVATSPDRLLARICRFLGVRDHGVAVRGKVNASRYGSLVMPPRVAEFLRDFYAPELDHLNRVLRNYFGSEIPQSWYFAEVGLPAMRVVEGYRGWDVDYDDGRFLAVPRGDEGEEGAVGSTHFWQVLPNCNLSLEQNLETLMAWLCEEPVFG